MQIAVYGGSFDPPHVGHAMVASWLVWTGLVSRVWLVPTWRHPFDKALTPFEERLRWCEALAHELGDWADVCEVERSLGGTSYTVRTLESLAARWPEHDFRPVLGSDLRGSVHQWHDWERLQAKWPPIWVGRAGYGDVPGAPTFPDVSSTAVREILARGGDVRHLVPRGVLKAMVVDAQSNPKPDR